MNMQVPEGWALQLSRLLTNIGYGDPPAPAIAAAKSRLMHAAGVSLANSRLPAASVAWKAVPDGSGPCFVFGRLLRISAAEAAFVNGVIGHNSLLEDCGPGGLREGSHPGTFIIPAALAAAEMTGADGKALLTGLIVGYEAVSRIGAAASPKVVQRRFRPVGVMGAFGAAAAVCSILDAKPEQMAAALAIAGNLSGGSTQGIFEGTMEPYFQAGFGARNGFLAARLALAGATTSKQALEGEFGFFHTYGGEDGRVDILLGNQSRFGIENVGTKRFAACLQNQETIAVILAELQAPLSVDAIQRVVIRRPAFGTNGLNSPGVSRDAPFDNMLSAQMSARFTAAAALLGLPVHDPSFFSGCFADPDIARLTASIDLEPVDDETVCVEVALRDGGRLRFASDQRQVLFPGEEAIQAAFLKRVRPLLGAGAWDAAAMFAGLEELPDVRTLTEMFRAAGA